MKRVVQIGLQREADLNAFAGGAGQSAGVGAGPAGAAMSAWAISACGAPVAAGVAVQAASRHAVARAGNLNMAAPQRWGEWIQYSEIALRWRESGLKLLKRLHGNRAS